MERVPMLAEGYEKLTADLQVLRQERPRIVDQIEEARSHGDLAENAEYHAAKERQGQVEAQIAEIEDRVTRAQIIDPTSLSGDRVVFGATVTVLDEDDKKQRYQIVGMTEADARQGRISYDSPLGTVTSTSSPTCRPIRARPSGESYEMRPTRASASVMPTIW